MAGDRLPRKVMDAKRLASLLRGGPGGPLVIDSRSFVEYNSWHVLSSVNICCSKLVKRRLQQGKVTIAELIQPAARSQMEAAEPQDVVVYDQSTRDASVLAADSFLSILLSKLDGCFDSVAILTGDSGGGHWLSPTALGAGPTARSPPSVLLQGCRCPVASGPGHVGAFALETLAEVLRELPGCSLGLLSPRVAVPGMEGEVLRQRVLSCVLRALCLLGREVLGQYPMLVFSFSHGVQKSLLWIVSSSSSLSGDWALAACSVMRKD
ncbi:hypothetical protein E5288_WYG016264 [Bos mutus]|uniref:Rhodanese domain-containing protein n=1 Tax=Bos mutus TaxID=72004 RepID=A0A6B0RK20_9CETA|nr:hypothetical protein [Bos mutus]